MTLTINTAAEERLDLNLSDDDGELASDHTALSDQAHYCPSLAKEYPYLALVATYEKSIVNGISRPYAMLAAIGINREGHQDVLGATTVDRQSHISWCIFLEGLRVRGLRGVEVVLTNGHAIQKRAVREILPNAHMQSCDADFRRRAIETVLHELETYCSAQPVAQAG